jgi:hypothetical protein
MMTRVSVPFTEGHYYGRGERPNTELADNSPSIDIFFPVGFLIHNIILVFNAA